jgi:hypothetical protein
MPGPGSARPAWFKPFLAVTFLAAAALLTAACGGPSSAGGSSGAGAASGAGQSRLAQALAFAHCMRSHGLPSFPDPDSAGGFPMSQSSNSSVQAFMSAKAACNHLYPNMGKGQVHQETAAQQRHGLLFAACMRRHGIPGFPDDWSGNVGQLISAHIDPSSPQLNAALTKCGF